MIADLRVLCTRVHGVACADALSRKEVDPEEWEAKGLYKPPPVYAEGAYDSTRVKPSPAEKKLYPRRAKRQDLSVRSRACLRATGQSLLCACALTAHTAPGAGDTAKVPHGTRPEVSQAAAAVCA